MAGELKPGDRFLDRFRIQYLAAEGGMASIYVAADEMTGHEIAVKSLYPYYIDNQIIRTRFLEEGRIQKVLRHPNVIRVFDVIEEPALAILMEYVDGPTLDDFLGNQGPLSTEQVIDVIIPVMSAVGFAHSRGIIHRDIKPSNILLQGADPRSPKVLDFGVAKIKGAKEDLTATGTTVGTLHYMSPEQIVGSREIDGRADIYSLGVTMYKLVTGEVPFNAPTEFALMMAQVEAPPLPPSRLRADLSADLEHVILKAMEKKPADRYQTIKDFTSDLLDLRMGSNRHERVGETVSKSISSEIIELALKADEVAVDLTSESGFFVLTDHDLDFGLVQMDNSTTEIEATIKIEHVGNEDTRPNPAPSSTSELSNSQVMRLTRASRESLALDEDQTIEESSQETMPIPSLQERLKKERDRGSETVETDSSEDRTRPSRPSSIISEKDLPKFPGTQDETMSIEKRVRVPRPADSGALRSGVHVADDDANSRDMTAPKLSERDYRAILERKAAEPSRSEYESAPKIVIGDNPADTNEQTELRSRGEVRSKLKQFRERQRQKESHVQGMSVSSDPLEDGRVHLPLRKDDGDAQRSNLEIGPTEHPQEWLPTHSDSSNTGRIVVAIVLFFVMIISGLVFAALLFI